MIMKKIWILILLFAFIFGYCLVGAVFAGGVTDNNNGSAGNILIHSGTTNGANDVGTWTDSSAFKGDKGDTGANGQSGISGTDGASGKDGATGKGGVKGKQGKQGAKGERGKGIKDAYELQLEGVIKETRKTATSIYYIRDFNNQRNTIGAKFKYYFGQSYADQVREDLQRQINELRELQGLISKEAVIDHFKEDGMEIIPLDNGFVIQKRKKF